MVQIQRKTSCTAALLEINHIINFNKLVYFELIVLRTLILKAKRHCSGTDALKFERGTGLALYQSLPNAWFTDKTSFPEEN